jgi:Na+/melibiose symporter-like transporter
LNIAGDQSGGQGPGQEAGQRGSEDQVAPYDRASANGLLTRWPALGPLGNKDFLRMWFATGLWWQAMWMEQVVFGWLALELTNSPWLVALIGFFRSIPLLFIGLGSSLVTDRFPRRYIVLILQGLNAIGCIVLLIIYLNGTLAYAHLAAVALANGVWWALDWPTRRALLPDLVGKDRVVEGMLLENVLQGFTRISGPLVAGGVLGILGTGGSLYLLALLAVLAFVTLIGLKTTSQAPQQPKGIKQALRQVGAGWAYVFGHRKILGVVCITIAMNIWAFPFMGLLPVFARDVLHQGPWGLGMLGAANGLGALLGLVWVNICRRRWDTGLLFAGGSILACGGLIGFAFSGTFAWSIAALVLAGIGMAGFSILQSAIILVEADDEMRGRAMSAVVMAIGLGPLGRMQSGAMAESWGAPLAVGAMALTAGIVTLGVLLFLGGFTHWGRTRTDPR